MIQVEVSGGSSKVAEADLETYKGNKRLFSGMRISGYYNFDITEYRKVGGISSVDVVSSWSGRYSTRISNVSSVSMGYICRAVGYSVKTGTLTSSTETYSGSKTFTNGDGLQDNIKVSLDWINNTGELSVEYSGSTGAQAVYASMRTSGSKVIFNYHDAVVSNLTNSNTDIENPINVAWSSQYQDKYQLELWQDGNKIKTYTGTTSTNLSIPKGAIISKNPVTIKLKVARSIVGVDYWSSYIEKTFTPTTPLPAVSSILVNQLNIDIPFEVSWLSTNQSKYEVEVWKDNIKQKTYAGTTSTRHTIPVGEITKTGEHIFKVRTGYNSSAGLIWSDYVSTSKNLTRIIPRITNFTVVDTFWEKAIRTNWRAENQSKFEFEILKDNVTIHSFNGEAENAFTIPQGTLTSGGAYSFRVRPIYVPAWSTTDVACGEWVERNITLKDIIATIGNLSLSGSNIDLPISLSWESTDQTKYEVEVCKNDDVIITKTGEIDNSVTFSNNTLTTGLHKFRVRVAYKESWTDWEEITATLFETLPSIGVFEPDGLIIERDVNNRIWWTSNNQSKWRVVVDDTLTYTGTTEKEFILPAGTLQTGNHKMILTVTYITPNNIEKNITKKAEFIIQGKPPIPTITSGESFESNRPVITWDTQDQNGYIVEVLQGSQIVHTSEWRNGLDTSYKIKTYLANGTYSVRIKVINQFSVESDYSTKLIVINANIEEVIPLEVRTSNYSNNLVWNNNGDYFKVFYILRNGLVIAKTEDTEYTDYTPHGESEYCIRGINEQDNYKDSNTITVNQTLGSAVIALTTSLSNLYKIGLSVNDYSFKGAVDLEYTLHKTSGRDYPVVVFGEHTEASYDLKCYEEADKLNLIKLCKEREIFIYRDRLQKLYLTIPTPNYTRNDTGLNYNLTAYAVDFTEVIAYD